MYNSFLMRLVVKTKSTGRVIREFSGNYNFQVFIAFENFVKERVMAGDFSEKVVYILEIHRL